MILTQDYQTVFQRIAAPSPGPGEVPTSNINQQVFQTFQHVIPGDWKIYREDKPSEHIKVGSVLLLGRDVRQHGDQYLVSVRWTLFDEDMNMAGLYKEAPTHYHPSRGSARVSLGFGVQGYRPGDEGALGGMIKVNGLPMTPIGFDEVDISQEADTPYEVAKSVDDVINYYNSGYFKETPGGVKLSKEYYVTKKPHEGYSKWKGKEEDDRNEGEEWKSEPGERDWWDENKDKGWGHDEEDDDDEFAR